MTGTEPGANDAPDLRPSDTGVFADADVGTDPGRTVHPAPSLSVGARSIDGEGEPSSSPEPASDAGRIIDDLRRSLLVERETSLNAVDAVLGAQAETAQVRAENKELLYRLHVREVELEQAKELLLLDDTDGSSAGGSPGDAERDGGEAPEIAVAARSLVRAARQTVRRA